MLPASPRILQVNARDKTGGAARIARSLHQAYRARGYTAWMAVSTKEDSDPTIREIPKFGPQNIIARQFLNYAELSRQRNLRIGTHHFEFLFKRISEPKRLISRFIGREDFDFPGSLQILDLFSEPPDIVHLHNLHENYFDLRFLPELSKAKPTIFTLHDAWLFSGHCAYPLDCGRWKTGCGHCPYLNIYPATPHDATHFNWDRKKRIFSQSKLYIATPSRWLLDRVNESILYPAVVESKVIHNGVDQSIFHPGDRSQVRSSLGIPEDVIVLLFVAQNGSNNPYKDFDTISKAIQLIEAKHPGKKTLCLALGHQKTDIASLNLYSEINLQSIPFQNDAREVAKYYQAADIYLQASRADTFPNVVLEALACGTPVIATRVGGIPEQILHGETGFLVSPGNPQEMAEKIEILLENPDLLQKMGYAAREHAQKEFDIDIMVDRYLTWYEDIRKDFMDRQARDKG